MAWTGKRIEALRSMWANGMSSAQIGDALSVSRNAVIGKVHRLGLSGSDGGGSNTGRKPGAPPAKPKPARAQTKVIEPTAPVGTEATDLPPDEFAPLRASILDTRSGECRYPLAGGFCGRRGEPWCPAHRRITTTPVRKVTRTLAPFHRA